MVKVSNTLGPRPGIGRGSGFRAKIIEAGNVKINAVEQWATVNDRHVDFTPMQFDLVLILCRSMGEISPVKDLIVALYGRDVPKTAVQNVHLFAHQIRKKLRGAGSTVTLVTHQGGGYSIQYSSEECGRSEALPSESHIGSPRRNARRWSPKMKAGLVAGVADGSLVLAEVLSENGIDRAEFVRWQQLHNMGGRKALTLRAITAGKR